MGRTAYDFNRYGAQDLRRYLECFELPRPVECDPREILLTLPRAEELFKSHENRNLATGHEAWRRLEWINKIRLEKTFLSMFLSVCIAPGFRLDKTVNQNDTIYSLPRALSDKFYTHKQCDIEEMKVWLTLPLVTATRVMHNVFTDSKPYVFTTDEVDAEDKSRFQFLLWRSRFDSVIPRECNGRLVVAFQTPFVLNEQDFCEFVACHSLPPTDRPFNTMPSRYKLWAKIWETCYRNKCRWFVLTSYTHWVFGLFSKSMRTAFVTPIYRSNVASPTILELLVYWLASAMEIQAAFVPVQTLEPVPMDDESEYAIDLETIKERLDQDHLAGSGASRTPRSVMSDYAWPGQNDNNYDDPDIDLESAFDGEESLHSHYPVQDKPDSKHDLRFQKWIASSRNAKYRKLDEDDFVPVNFSDMEYEEDDVFNPSMGRGEWMV